MGGRWFNRDAVEWVLYESDAPAEQLPALVVVASFVDTEGRGAYPARSVVALLTRRSIRKTVADLAELLRLGHLIAGDWRRVAHIRAGRRPNVYDLPEKYRAWLKVRGEQPAPRAGKRGAGSAPRTPSRGAIYDTDGVQSTTVRGADPAPKEFMKNSRKGAAGAQGSAPRPDAPPPPPLAEPHRYTLGTFGFCETCQLPEANRVHHGGRQ